MMETVARCAVFSLMMGISCKAFFESFVPVRKGRYKWMEYGVVFICAAGFMGIAFTEIPPYFLQPVRVIAVTAISAQLCFQVRAGKNLILSVVFCGIYWMITMLLLSIVYAFLIPWAKSFYDMLEAAAGCLHLCVMLFFRHKFRKRVHGLFGGRKWAGRALFPLLGMIVIVAIGMMPWDGTSADKYGKLAAVWGFAAIYLCVFYYMENMLEKEEEVQSLRLVQARTQNQMDMYHRMQKSYEQQKRYLHDYKNQLACISGMIDKGQVKEALQYIEKLTGSLRKNADFVDTNHTVVNVVLNQKYQEALEKGITMAVAVNDLSGLAMSEEEIVILLVNLLDNAIEACGRLVHDRIIQFKMMLEEGQLILSVRNPVKDVVPIEGNLVPASKKAGAGHGIGLVNVDSVIRKNEGISVLKCEEGWFSFSAMVPNEAAVEKDIHTG